METERLPTALATRSARTVLWAQDLRERWGVSLCTIWRWRRAGLVPEPDFMDSGWRLETIEKFERAGGIPARPTSSPGRPARHK